MRTPCILPSTAEEVVDPFSMSELPGASTHNTPRALTTTAQMKTKDFLIFSVSVYNRVRRQPKTDITDIK